MRETKNWLNEKLDGYNDNPKETLFDLLSRYYITFIECIHFQFDRNHHIR